MEMIKWNRNVLTVNVFFYFIFFFFFNDSESIESIRGVPARNFAEKQKDLRELTPICGVFSAEVHVERFFFFFLFAEWTWKWAFFIGLICIVKIEINYLIALKCFPNFGAVRTITRTYDKW